MKENIYACLMERKSWRTYVQDTAHMHIGKRSLTSI